MGDDDVPVIRKGLGGKRERKEDIPPKGGE